MFMTSLILLAAAAPDPAATATQPTRDSEIVCIDRVQTGSRTNIERTCHTRAEWAALRRAERAAREPDRPNLYYPRGG